jgi:hypothetical protein
MVRLHYILAVFIIVILCGAFVPQIYNPGGGGGGGTVTSITVTAPLTGGTITTSGTIGLPAGQLFPAFTIPTVGATFSTLTSPSIGTIADNSWGSSILVTNDGTNQLGAWATIPASPYTVQTAMSCSTNATDALNTGAQYGFGVRQSSATSENVGQIIIFSPTAGSLTSGTFYRTCNFTADGGGGSCGNVAATATGDLTWFRTTDDNNATSTSRKRWWSNNGRVWTAGDGGENPATIVANQYGFFLGGGPNTTTWTCAVMNVETWCASGCTHTCSGAACVQPQVLP